MELSEKEYKKLYKYSLNVAYKFVSYSDFAFDIAQNSILALISSKREIKSPYSWLRTTVKNEALRIIKDENKQTDVIERKSVEQATQINIEDESDDILKISIQKIKTILSPNDFEIFRQLKKYGFSLTTYAKKKNVNINTIKTAKQRIKRNIISTYLFEDGWRNGTMILNYPQFRAINRFIYQILNHIKNNEVIKIREYFRKIANFEIQFLFDNVEDCLEWNVIYRNDFYRVVFVCSPIKPLPQVIELDIKFNRSDYLNIIDARIKKPIFIAEKPATEVIKYKDKGKIELTEDKILAILTDKKTNN